MSDLGICHVTRCGCAGVRIAFGVPGAATSRFWLSDLHRSYDVTSAETGVFHDTCSSRPRKQIWKLMRVVFAVVCPGSIDDLLNPKIAIFYISFLPQFIPPSVNVAGFSMLLTIIHACEGFIWFNVLTTATTHLSTWLRVPLIVRALDLSTGLVLVGFGLAFVIQDWP
jgi:hypothetical protein